MKISKQKFNVDYANKATFQDGLREFLEYRDLGITDASNGAYKAHVLRVKKEFKGDQEMHTTGFHRHLVDFQMYYVLNGWVKFIYDGEGELSDAASVLDWLQQYNTNSKTCWVAGFSFGAWVAMQLLM